MIPNNIENEIEDAKEELLRFLSKVSPYYLWDETFLHSYFNNKPLTVYFLLNITPSKRYQPFGMSTQEKAKYNGTFYYRSIKPETIKRYLRRFK